jgi:hypothetical protein
LSLTIGNINCPKFNNGMKVAGPKLSDQGLAGRHRQLISRLVYAMIVPMLQAHVMGLISP